MSTENISNDETSPENRPESSETAKRIMSITGYLMLIVSAGLLVFLAWNHYRVPIITDRPEDGQLLTVWILQNFADDLLIFLGSIFLSVIGIKLLGAAGKGTPTTILPEDRELLEPLIKNANKDAINQYVVLSSLSGFTGTFQKIGFSGLPLATVTLTLVFSMLSFFEPEFLELAKLTLGAFIGSFVQKGTDATKLPSIKWNE